MKKRLVTALIALSVGALVLFSVYEPERMLEPGALIDAHSDLTADCFACHTPFFGASSSRCIDCHEVRDIGKRTTKGEPLSVERKRVAFHQELTEANCVACHSDHKGVMVFRPANQFAHELLRSNSASRCNGCHAKPEDSLHKQIQGECGECHSQRRWSPATFNHDEHFRFDKDHSTDCVTCHVSGNYSDYTCYGCHEHSRPKIQEEHIEEGIRDFEECTDCHRSADEDEAKKLMRTRGGAKGSLRARRKDERRDSD